MLCGSFALLALLILLGANAIDGEVTRQLIELMTQTSGAASPGTGAGPSAEAIADLATDPRIIWGFLLRTGGLSLLAVPYWHAPALVHWGGQTVPQALFSSTLALWRNRAAFALNALIWGGLMLAATSSVSLVFGLLGLMQFAPMVLIGCVLMLSTAFYASLYFSFVDCFMFGVPADALNDLG